MMRREQFMVSDKYGSRSVPSAGGSIIGGIVIVGFGIVWTTMAATMGAPFFFPLFGVIFILGGIAKAVSSVTKASDYSAAEASYQEYRENVLKEIRNR
jgi:predicted phage tail protein